jgi:hypothetical protein
VSLGLRERERREEGEKKCNDNVSEREREQLNAGHSMSATICEKREE